MADIYDRLTAAGFPKQFLRDRILPDWWTDEADQDPDMVLTGAMILSDRLNLKLRSLLESGDEVVFAQIDGPIG